MASKTPPTSKIPPLLIGTILGLLLMTVIFTSLGGGGDQEEGPAESRPWRVLTVNNSSVDRNGLPFRVICSMPQKDNDILDSTSDCYLRSSLRYNPKISEEGEFNSGANCQLSAGFVSLVVGIGDQAVVIDSQVVDLSATDGDCNLQPGIVVGVLFRFESVPVAEKLGLIRFVGIDPQLELVDNLEFVNN